eukprot:3939088-Pyramimonas_sp.AAC.1
MRVVGQGHRRAVATDRVVGVPGGVAVGIADVLASDTKPLALGKQVVPRPVPTRAHSVRTPTTRNVASLSATAADLDPRIVRPTTMATSSPSDTWDHGHRQGLVRRVCSPAGSGRQALTGADQNSAKDGCRAEQLCLLR